MDDSEIVRRLQRGDASGLEALLRQHGPFVKSALRNSFAYTLDADELESSLHDGALIMWQSEVSARLDPNRSIRSFYYVTCRRELMRAWSKNPPERPLDPTILDATISTPAPSDGTSTGPTLDELLAGLSPLERAILMTDIASNFTASSAEIAELLSTTAASVDSLRHRIRKKLRKWVVTDSEGDR